MQREAQQQGHTATGRHRVAQQGGQQIPICMFFTCTSSSRVSAGAVLSVQEHL